MINDFFEKQFKQLLSLADIEVNGRNPWDIQIKNPDTYKRSIIDGHLGLGESYMEGWWDCDDLEEFFYRILDAKIDKKIIPPILIFGKIIGAVFNMQKSSRVFDVANTHYNLDVDLFEAMLGRKMIYSCGYWKEATNLDDAQEAKLKLIFDKLELKEGESVLDIGCGWGGAAMFAAGRYNTKVRGTTISIGQAEEARKRTKYSNVNIDFIDYRNITGKYDKIYSIGMFEHVGYKNYRSYFEVVNRCLKRDGLTLLHTIGTNTPSTAGDPWTNKYIFPNGMLPSASQITKAYEGLFVLEDWHCFGYDYSLTLKEWFKNFDVYWDKMLFKKDDTFYRMWKYYLLSFSGAFRSRNIQVWQILLSKEGIRGRHEVCR